MNTRGPTLVRGATRWWSTGAWRSGLRSARRFHSRVLNGDPRRRPSSPRRGSAPPQRRPGGRPAAFPRTALKVAARRQSSPIEPLPFPGYLTSGGTVTATRGRRQYLRKTVSGRHDLTPFCKGLGAEDLERAAGNQMALDVEVIGDGGVGREEALCRSWRSETELLPLSAPGRLMRDLRPVVRAPAGDVAIGQAEVAQGSAVRSKPVRHDRFRDVAVPLQSFRSNFSAAFRSRFD